MNQVRSRFSTARLRSSVHRFCENYPPTYIGNGEDGPGHSIYIFFVKCNRLQTTCEQFATVFTWREGVHRFVNKVQPIVITAANEDGPQATKHRVVEHKGSSDEVVDFVW